MTFLDMSARSFMHTFFGCWQIAGTTTCGTEHGTVTLRHGDTKIKVFVNLNGETHWTGQKATVDHVEGYNEMF